MIAEILGLILHVSKMNLKISRSSAKAGVSAKLDGKLTISKKEWNESAVKLQVGFNKSPEIVVSHTVQGHKIFGNLKIRNATISYFVKMNPLLFQYFSPCFHWKLHCKKVGGGQCPLPQF